MGFLDSLFGSSKSKKKQQEIKIDPTKKPLIDAGKRGGYFEDIDPLYTIEDSFYILKNRDISIGLELDLFNDEQKSANDLEELTKTFGQAITSVFKVGTTFHFQKIFYNGTGNIVNKVSEKGSPGFITKMISRHYTDRIQKEVKAYLYISFPFNQEQVLVLPSATSFSKGANINTKTNLWENDCETLDYRKRAANSQVKNFLSQMNGFMGITMKRMSTKQLAQNREQYFNLAFGKTNQGLYSEISHSHDSLKVGSNYVGTVYMRDSGSEVYISKPNNRGIHSSMAYALGTALIKEPHIVNTTFKILNTDKVLGQLESEVNRITGLSSLGGRANLINAEQKQAFLEEMHEEDEDVFVMNQNVLIWDTDPERLADTKNSVISAFRTMNGSSGAIATYDEGNYYFTYSPGAAADMFFGLVVPKTQALTFLDFAKTTKGENQGILMCNRELTPVLVDLWSDKLESKNRIILGPSGSGKSFSVNNIITQEYEDGVEVVIIDIGGSYRNLIQINNGSYIELTPENPIALNPFLMPTNKSGEYIIDADKVTFLRTLISFMWKETDSSSNTILSKEEEAILDNFIEEYFDHINNINEDIIEEEKKEIPILGSFIEFLSERHKKNMSEQTDIEYIESMEFFNMSSFFLVLNKFVNGKYASVFNTKTTTVLEENPLICFDLSNIKKDPILYPIMSLIIIELVLNKIDKNIHIRKELILDEAFEFMTGNMSEFLEKTFRQIRKANGAVSIATQTVNELVNSPVGPAIIANAPVKILLNHNSQKDLFGPTQNALGLTNSEMLQLASLRTEGKWRECLIKRGDTTEIFAIDVGPHAAKAFSTSGDDRAKMAEYSKKYSSKELIINQMIEDENAE